MNTSKILRQFIITKGRCAHINIKCNQCPLQLVCSKHILQSTLSKKRYEVVLRLIIEMYDSTELMEILL